MEFKDTMLKEVKLTETEKDTLDKAWGIIDRFDDIVHKFIVVNDEKMYSVRDIRLVLSMLEDLVETDNAITIK